MQIETVIEKVETAIKEVYKRDIFLVQKELCERCINHRFALYLDRQNFGQGYYVDCEYNKAHLVTPDGIVTSPKLVSSINGNYIDIIITKRDGRQQSDLLCFEIKKASNRSQVAERKDRKNLEILTRKDGFGYKAGFYIIFDKNHAKYDLYQNGSLARGAIDIVL